MTVNFSVDILEFVFLIVPWIVVVGWLSARVLGIHLGRWRATVVAVFGWVGGLLITLLIFNRDPGVAEGVPATIFFGVVVAMPIAIVLARRGGHHPRGGSTRNTLGPRLRWPHVRGNVAHAHRRPSAAPPPTPRRLTP